MCFSSFTAAYRLLTAVTAERSFCKDAKPCPRTRPYLKERAPSRLFFSPTQQKGAVLFLPSAFPLALTSVKLAVKTCTPLRTPEHHELSPRPSLTRIQFGKNNIEGQQSAGGHCPMYIVALSALHDLSGGKGVRVHGLTVQSFVHCALEDMLVST